MRYQKILSQIWFDEKFAALSPMQQRLFFYILTCPHGNLIGCFVLRPGYVCADLKCSPKDFQKDFAKLLEMGLIRACRTHDLVLIPNFLKHNPLTNPNQKKAAVKTLLELPKSELLLHFKGLVEGLPESFWEGLSKPETETETETETPLYPLASEGASRAGVVLFVRRDKPKPRELCTNPRAVGTNPRAQGTNPRAVAANPRAQPDFEAFWQAYPRKVGKKAALKAWLKAADKPPLEEMLAALEAQKQSPQWQKDGGQYIPLPATWLNQGRWADEIASCQASACLPARPRADPDCPDCQGEGWVHFERDGRQFSRRCKCWRARDD